MRYLDPKNDLTFKKVFGRHPHLLQSFLNALLPLEEGRQIESLQYMGGEMTPVVPGLKHSIVDVRCRDNYGRQFIVEMQILWTAAFKSRVLFNASKAYVTQLPRGEEYHEIQPVYALSLVDHIFEPGSAEYYHHYRFVHTVEPERRLEGLELIFIELPKFTAANLLDKRMQVLWLRYMTEIRDQVDQISPDLLAVPELVEAVEYLRESAFTRDELIGYDQYWDAISSERTRLGAATREGRAEGRTEGRAEGRAEGKQEGKHEAALAIAQRLMETGVGASTVSEATGLTLEQVWQATTRPRLPLPVSGAE